MAGKTIRVTISIGILLLLLADYNHALITESPAPQPQPSSPESQYPQPSSPESQYPQPSPDLPLNGATPGSLLPEDCGPRCLGRCAKTAFKKPCMFFCKKCCAKCLCVPPGTYGNKQLCPCYNNWKTKRGGPKCP